MIDLLVPRNVNHTKIRLGPNRDGGIVVPEIILTECSEVFSYGFTNPFGFEIDVINRYDKRVRIFDNRYEHANRPLLRKLSLHNEGLFEGQRKRGPIEHYLLHNSSGKVFLKIDVEGAEFDYFEKVDVEVLSKIALGISVEVHWLFDETLRNSCFNMIRKLNQFYTLCHVHSNNHQPLIQFQGHFIPGVAQLTFIHKELVTNEEPDSQEYPIDGLDFPDWAGAPDHKLEYIKHFNK